MTHHLTLKSLLRFTAHSLTRLDISLRTLGPGIIILLVGIFMLVNLFWSLSLGEVIVQAKNASHKMQYHQDVDPVGFWAIVITLGFLGFILTIFGNWLLNQAPKTQLLVLSLVFGITGSGLIWLWPGEGSTNGFSLYFGIGLCIEALIISWSALKKNA